MQTNYRIMHIISGFGAFHFLGSQESAIRHLFRPQTQLINLLVWKVAFAYPNFFRTHILPFTSLNRSVNQSTLFGKIDGSMTLTLYRLRRYSIRAY